MSRLMQMSAHVQIAKEEPKWEADGAKSRKTGIKIGHWIDAILARRRRWMSPHPITPLSGTLPHQSAREKKNKK